VKKRWTWIEKAYMNDRIKMTIDFQGSKARRPLKSMLETQIKMVINIQTMIEFSETKLITVDYLIMHNIGDQLGLCNTRHYALLDGDLAGEMTIHSR
jgi:hypothetical protein